LEDNSQQSGKQSRASTAENFQKKIKKSLTSKIRCANIKSQREKSSEGHLEKSHPMRGSPRSAGAGRKSQLADRPQTVTESGVGKSRQTKTEESGEQTPRDKKP